MRSVRARLLSNFAIGVSTAALIVPALASAQDAAATVGQTGPSQTQSPPSATGDVGQGDGDIVVTGIRASLRESIDLKRNAQGIVDAISAEDMGKFPDTNLAESLQRITGVSIDRSNGEGQFVTVRGFGPEYNLVTLNGRQMPTSTIGDGNSAPGSRSFDFANIASEGVAALEVYKSGRASVPSGGIGSTINIRTPRPFDKPGLRGSIAARGVVDTSQNGHKDITPEVSGIISDTFADDKIGILITGAYQRRNFSANQVNIGWRDGYLGNENNWGSLAQPGDPRYANITNHPKATDVYQVPQNGGYDVVNGRRERINGQAVLQFRPIDSVTATVDYTYSRNTIDIRDNSVGIWYNHNDTVSAWTDGPVAGPIFYTERFGAGEGKDLAYSASQTAVRNENKSLGGNIVWDAPGGVTMTLDAHHSTAESKPNSPYGNSNSVGTAVFGIQNQTINFDHDLPVISYNMYPGIDPLNAANIVPTGNAFRNSYFRDEINQVQVRGHYDNGHGFMDSLDWGLEYTDNKVRSAYSVLQNDTWGGTGGDSAAQRAAAAALLPDSLFKLTSIPDKFSGISGANDPNIIKSFYSFDLPSVVKLLDQAYKICGGNGQCLIPYNTDSRVREKTMSSFFQFNGKFDAFSREGHLIAGVRYENTDVSASALVPTPVGARQNSQNEFNVLYQGSGFTTFKGSYHNWLPSVDFDISPLENVKLRASYSHTITRADYGSLQGGRRIDQLFRVGGGTGGVGNPNLIPYKSKNIDLSAEWYYTKDSYISVGYFHKDVANYIGQTQVNTTIPGITTPYNGPRYQAAVAALTAAGRDLTFANIRDYIGANYPTTVTRDANGNPVTIIAQPNDPLVNFVISTPFNSNQTAAVDGFEFAIQHNFWNTGFGTILNYTIVNGNRNYDNKLPASVSQFAITGLSDSANAVLFFDKYGINARAAYNWRKGYLAGAGINPYYINTYGQLDASASYAITPKVTIFAEGINLLGENRSGHLRSDRNIAFVTKQDARYSAGVRFTF
ncbi:MULTISPECIES: TonB-dependent receptor [unclassified Sphingomonas]|jgi:TonB-dependent receptor|uniref:TonB-dependent receptor n=2 Tax=Bacteria TaxID=2 RepID=UPI000E10B0EC|nr:MULTISPECIES: TonB-dependent receptor [unclassified Sphingomonas]AXJ96242.1 TonB-dependent receptor [Sphingomonas sp. FARSPH]